MSLKPWEPGYVAPEFDVEKIYSDRGRAAGSATAKIRQERINQVLTDDPDADPSMVNAAVVSKLSKHLETRTEENLSAKEKIFYQDFAVEYLRDFDPSMAWIRAGGKPKSAAVRSRQVLRTPYVQQLIQRVTDSLEEENLVTRKQIILGLWQEANDRGEGSSGGARVRALMGLARIKKMDVHTQKLEVETKHNVMHVPMPVDNDAWAQAAEDSQRALKENVRT